MSIRDFFKRDLRAQAPVKDYTQQVEDYLHARATGGAPAPHELGAVEAAVSYVEKAFMAGAAIEPSGIVSASDLTPHIRGLITEGESLSLFTPAAEGGYIYTAASGWQITGATPDERGWSYEVQLTGPSGTSAVRRPAKTVLHYRSSVDLRRGTHKGQSSLYRARKTTQAAEQTELATWGDMRGANIRAVINTDPSGIGIRGRQRDDITRTMRESFGEATSAGKIPVLAPGFSFVATPQAAGPRQGLGGIRELISTEMTSLCGVPAALLGYGSASASTTRELYRQWSATTLAALGAVFANELNAKLKTDIKIRFGKLMAADMAGKARAYKSLIDSGFSEDDAAELLHLDG